MKITIPSMLRQSAAEPEVVEVEGRTVGECLDALQQKLPDLKSYLFDPMGNPRKHLLLFLNDRNIINRLDTPVTDEDNLLILYAISGG
jgi:molybdopterin converting factor small subunit